MIVLIEGDWRRNERDVLMGEKSTSNIYVGRGGRAEVWRHYLPTDSQATECFLEPVTVVVSGPIHDGPLPKHRGRPMKVFIGDKPTWQETHDILRAFACLWVEILRVVTELTPACASLVFFSGVARHEEMFELWPYLPFGSHDQARFYVSEVRRDSRTNTCARVWLCVEYAYEGFKRLAAPDGFEYSYGTTIMGMSVVEASAKAYLSKDPLNKSALEKSLDSQDVRCWWLCDADFEGMTIWHKDYTGDELAKHLESLAG